MSDLEKNEIQNTITAFANAWATRDEARLRTLVDADRLLEITTPEKRGGKTSADVWKRVWQEPLQHEPHWQSYAITTEFAFEAMPRLLTAVPLNVGGWPTDRTLPGLNVLAWLDARQEDGQDYKIGVRLYLVKRTTGWKVFQFGQLRNGAATIP